MHGIADQFGLPGRVKAPSLNDGNRCTNADLAVHWTDPLRLPVVKRDYVSGAAMTEKSLIEAGNLGAANQLDGNLKLSETKEFEKKRADDPAQQPIIDRQRALPVLDQDRTEPGRRRSKRAGDWAGSFHPGFVSGRRELPRCSS